MIKTQLDNLPLKTGIYKFLDDKNNILYIGKALNLRARVSSYFREKHYDRPHIIKMVPLIKRVETIITENDIESIILEAALIKKYKPKFNILSKDDKSFAWIYISTKEKFPKVTIVRSIKKGEFKNGKLFGPYPQGKSAKRIFNYIRKLFPFCTCKNPKEPCLYYHLDLCPGPYHNKISEDDYRENINNIIKFLSGKKRNIMNKLRKEMQSYAQTQDFEKAAKLRDKIDDLEYLSQKISISPFESEDEYLNLKYENIKKALKLLSKQLSLQSIKRIECYDISNIQGFFGYGAMSVAIDGKISPEEYRIFKIKEITTPDDPKMLSEVLSRRLKQENAKPDLILLDGGKTQLSVIKRIVPQEIKLLAISKGKRLKKKKDEFWYSDKGKIKNINIQYPSLLIQLRDEAHRFGIKYHRQNRAKYLKTSVLDKIEGIGVKRKKVLIKHFGDLENIKRAKLEEIENVLKNKKVALNVYSFLRKSN
jgi:excinuclease UvrABC nuclease subunit